MSLLQRLAMRRRGPQATRAQHHGADHGQGNQQLAQNASVQPTIGHGLQGADDIAQCFGQSGQ
jgi:hypothetical protein